MNDLAENYTIRNWLRTVIKQKLPWKSALVQAFIIGALLIGGEYLNAFSSQRVRVQSVQLMPSEWYEHSDVIPTVQEHGSSQILIIKRKPRVKESLPITSLAIFLMFMFRLTKTEKKDTEQHNAA